MAESFYQPRMKPWIGILLILIILLFAIQFIQTDFVVLLTIPFGIIGVFGLALVQQPFVSCFYWAGLESW